MKRLLLVLIGSSCAVLSQAQFVSNAQIYIGSEALVSVNAEVTNTGTLASEGSLHLRKGLNNQGQLSLNGRVILDGEGTQLIQSATPIKTGTLILAQQGKIALRAPMSIEKQLTFGKGIIETMESNPIEIADNANVVGASDQSHVKGYIRKIGDDAFEFPVGDGSQLHAFAVSKPLTNDEIQVGFVNQNPIRLTSNRATDIEELTGNNYWAVQGARATNPLQVSIASSEAAHQLLQLRDQQWNLTPSTYANNTVSAQTVLTGATYFTVGTQLAASAEKAEISVYPNPSEGAFEVRLKGFSAEENISVDIADLSGRIIATQSGKVKSLNNKYNLSQEAANGSYILRVSRPVKNQTLQQNLLINK